MTPQKKQLLQFWKRYFLLLLGMIIVLELIIILGSRIVAADGSPVEFGWVTIVGLATVPLFYLVNFSHVVRFNPGLLTDLSIVGILFNFILFIYASLAAAIMVSLRSYQNNSARWKLFFPLTALLFVVGWGVLFFLS